MGELEDAHEGEGRLDFLDEWGVFCDPEGVAPGGDHEEGGGEFFLDFLDEELHHAEVSPEEGGLDALLGIFSDHMGEGFRLDEGE